MVAAALPLMVGLGAGQRAGDCCPGSATNALLGFLPPAAEEVDLLRLGTLHRSVLSVPQWSIPPATMCPRSFTTGCVRPSALEPAAAPPGLSTCRAGPRSGSQIALLTPQWAQEPREGWFTHRLRLRPVAQRRGLEALLILPRRIVATHSPPWQSCGSRGWRRA